MGKKTLELATEEEIGICANPKCGRVYDLKERQKHAENYPKENTVGNYCSDSCWVISTNGREAATRMCLVVK